MEYAVLVAVVVVVVWYFGNSLDKSANVINGTLEVSADMANRKLQRMAHEQKMDYVKKYAEDKVDEELVKTASDNKAVIDSIDI